MSRLSREDEEYARDRVASAYAPTEWEAQILAELTAVRAERDALLKALRKVRGEMQLHGLTGRSFYRPIVEAIQAAERQEKP